MTQNKNIKWLMWGLLLPTYFISFFHRTSMSPIGNIVIRQLNISGKAATILGILTGIYFFTYAFMQFPSGYLADTIGPKRIVSFGSIVMGIATALFGFNDNLMIAYLLRFFIGLGASFNFLCLLRIQTNWFKESEFTLLTGITIFIGNSGALFGLGPFAMLVEKINLQNSFLIFGTVSVLFGILIMIFVKNHPDGNFHEQIKTPIIEIFKTVFKNKNNYLSFIAFGLSNGAYITLVGFCCVPFLMHVYEISKVEASMFTTVITLGVVIGCLFNGLQAKVFNYPKYAGIAMLTAAVIFWILLIILKLDREYLWIYYFVFFIFGFLLSGINLIFSNVRANNPKALTASALAFTNSGGFISTAIFQSLSGIFLDLFVKEKNLFDLPVYPHHAYRALFIILLAIHISAVISYLFLKKEIIFKNR